MNQRTKKPLPDTIMFSQLSSRSLLFAIPLVGSVMGANSVTYDFESSSSGDLFAGGGVAGWSQDTANPSAFGQTFPLAYISTTDFGGGASNSAHLGTQFANTPDNASTTITGSLSALPIHNTLSASFNVAVLDNAADSFEGRDAFNIGLVNSAGSYVATIGFSPTVGDNEIWDVAVGVNGSTSTTPYQVSANSAYSFYINSDTTGTDFRFGPAGGNQVTIDSFDALGTLGTITGIAFEHEPLAAVGTSANTLAFDNVNVQVPEPSSSLLMILSAGLLAVRRRR